MIFPKAAPGLPPEAIGFREKDGSRGLLSLGCSPSPASSSPGSRCEVRRRAAQTSSCSACSSPSCSRSSWPSLNWILDKLTGYRFLSAMAQQTTFVMVPPLFLIFLVLGTIFIGIATPTEGGAMGADRRAAPRRRQAPAELGSDPSGDRIDRQAVGFRHFHPDRRPGVLADLLWRERPRLGRAPADLAARRAGRLPHLRQRARLHSRLLPGFLRTGVHHHPAAGASRRKTREST